jgi:hypothetical protein
MPGDKLQYDICYSVPDDAMPQIEKAAGSAQFRNRNGKPQKFPAAPVLHTPRGLRGVPISLNTGSGHGNLAGDDEAERGRAKSV